MKRYLLLLLFIAALQYRSFAQDIHFTITGLGLSLTYDMVVKGHGGKIEVNTEEGEFTEFIVTLPV